MLRTLLIVSLGVAVAYFAAQNGRIGGFDIADVPLALIGFAAFSAAIVLSLRWI